MTRYKSFENAGKPLIGTNNHPILDVHQKPVICDGQWKSLISVKHLFSTITKIHRFRGQDVLEYKDECPDYFSLYKDGQPRGCSEHDGTFK